MCVHLPLSKRREQEKGVQGKGWGQGRVRGFQGSSTPWSSCLTVRPALPLIAAARTATKTATVRAVRSMDHFRPLILPLFLPLFLFLRRARHSYHPWMRHRSRKQQQQQQQQCQQQQQQQQQLQQCQEEMARSQLLWNLQGLGSTGSLPANSENTRQRWHTHHVATHTQRSISLLPFKKTIDHFMAYSTLSNRWSGI